MSDFIDLLLMAAVPLLHLYTFFTEARHLNKWQPWQIIVMFALTGTWFIYFVSRTARIKLGIQLLLIAGIIALIFLSQ
ncbi:enterochelin ABC transporter [Eikenella sp. Marseille-P7795]|uniref:enterochelin ABC transporter n=1 Tax=Eikenella sp. Marseille-P7795 TaxID=2866577 RepID=UPI001CE470DA|nr:enterochelin ABC transporter [Eikenella sp. Marseille-P7795]